MVALLHREADGASAVILTASNMPITLQIPREHRQKCQAKRGRVVKVRYQMILLQIISAGGVTGISRWPLFVRVDAAKPGNEGKLKGVHVGLLGMICCLIDIMHHCSLSI